MFAFVEPNRLLAQQPEVPKIIPPAPNAAALGKFIESPTGLYNGIPSIGMPIWTVEAGEIRVPISLSYHAGGVKVAEIASNVGLGWALNCGGSITRSVMGLADETTLGYLNNNAIEDIPTYDNKLAYALNGLDGQPDMFYCSINGRSFRFVFDSGGNIVTIPKQNVKIEKGPIALITIEGTPTQAITRWQVTDEMGVIYKFNIYEYSASISMRSIEMTSNPNPAVNTWHLTEIISPKGEHVSFQYEDEEYDNDLLQRADVYIPRIPSGSSCGTLDLSGPKALRQYQFTQRLMSITFDGGKVRFVPHQDKRADLIGATALEKVVIENAAGQVARQFLFEHGYMVGRDILAYGAVQPAASERNRLTSFTQNFPESFKRRLMLLGIKEQDKNGVDINRGYSFEYFHDVGLPNRGYPLMDHWGFANGAEEFNPQLTWSERNGVYAWDGKTPNITYAKAGALNKVTYPTGGYATYSYDLNKVPPSPSTPVPYEYIQGPSLSISHAAAVLDRMEGMGSVLIDGYGTQKMKSHYIEFKIDALEGHIETNVKIENLPTTVLIGLIRYTIKKVISPEPNLVEETVWTGEKNGTSPLYLENGDYRMYHVPAWVIWSNPNSAEYMTLYNAQTTGWYQLKRPDPNVPNDVSVGGLRLREFRLYPSSTSDPLIYKYDYNVDNMSSGRLVTDPTYLWQYTEEIAPFPRIVEDCNYYVLSSESNFPLGTTQGSYVGYSFVTEQQVDKSGNPLGKTEQTFSFVLDGEISKVFPFYPYDNRDWMRGHPVTTSVYSYDHAAKSYSLVREIRNRYDFQSLTTVSSGWKYGISWKIVGGNGQNAILGGSYDIYSGYIMKSRTQVFERGVIFEDRTDYTYSTQSLLPVQTTHYKSDGGKELVFSTYPLEYAGSSNFIDALRSANILNTEIERVVVKEGSTGTREIVGGTMKKYDLSGNVTELYTLELPKPLDKTSFKFSSRSVGVLPPEGATEAFSADSRYVRRLTYDAYDGSRLLQYTLAGNANDKQSTTILWGYNKMYPVAEIRNATHATVSSVLGGNVSFGAGTLSTAQEGLLRASNTLRDAQVSTYTYTPLVGMTSSTDANNVTTTFDYDGFGRLRAVRDQRGDLVRSFRYNHAKPGVTGADLNFLEESTVNVSGIQQIDALATRPVEEVLRKKEFFDGLGRSLQTVTEKGAPEKVDVVQPFFYDVYGRESLQYLPYVSAGNTGWFNSDAVRVNGEYTSSVHYQFYNGADVTVARSAMPYAATVFEVSPLSRLLKKGAAGEDWQPGAADDHTEKREYITNAPGEVLLFTYNYATDELSFRKNGAPAYYGEGYLVVDVSRNEHNQEVREYKDKDGHVVLKRVEYRLGTGGKEYAETYYVYDDLGNLVTVLSLEATLRIKQTLSE